MSQSQKALDKLLRKPTPQDYRWDDLCALLKSLGFRLQNAEGSRRHFTGVFDGIERRISTHEPHPSGVLKRYVVREVEEKLREWGLIK